MGTEGLRGRAKAVFATTGAGALIASTLVVAAAAPASAAVLAVGTGAGFVAAVSDAASNPGADTIELTDDFTYSELSAPVYGSSDPLTIEGNGHTITVTSLGGLLSTTASTLSTITMSDVTIVGASLSPALTLITEGDITLTNVALDGYGSQSPPIVVNANNLTLSDSTFTNNTSASSGAAVSITSQFATITGSTFTGNTSGGQGGAVSANTVEDFDIENSTFTNNTSHGDGGAVFADGDVDIDNSTFTNNHAGTAGAFGGGAVGANGSVTADDSTFTGNGSELDGGAVAAFDYVDVERSTFANNTSDRDGGAIFTAIYIDAYGSTFSGNTASRAGGAIYTEGDDYFYAWESTFSGNTADLGGAIFAANDEVRVNLSTFADNAADASEGAGAHVFADGNLDTFGSIYTDAVNQPGCDVQSVTSQGGNIDVDGSCTDAWSGVFDNPDSNGGLEPLADNGGPTLTRMPRSTSAAIDLIDIDLCMSVIFDEQGEGEADGPTDEDLEALAGGENIPAELDADQRGVSRIEVYLGQGGGCDAGSVETFGPVEFDVTGPSGVLHFTVTGAIAVDCPINEAVGAVGGTPPAGIAFPHGATSFCLLLPWAGGSVMIDVDLPSPANQVWKSGNPTWIQVPGAVFTAGGTRVTYVVTDGGVLDADADVNRVIEDPVVFGIGAVFAG